VIQTSTTIAYSSTWQITPKSIRQMAGPNLKYKITTKISLAGLVGKYMK